jgi:hypothetical protein
MPVQIDHLETSVEILPQTGRPAVERAPSSAREPAAHVDVREAVARVLEEELERFSRMRGF